MLISRPSKGLRDVAGVLRNVMRWLLLCAMISGTFWVITRAQEAAWCVQEGDVTYSLADPAYRAALVWPAMHNCGGFAKPRVLVESALQLVGV